MFQQAGGQARVHGPEPEAEQSGAGSINQRQQPAAAQSLEPLLRETEGKVKEERGLQRFGDGIGPEDSPVKPVELAGVLEGIPGEGDQAEEIKVRGARGAPAPEEDVEADDEVNEADNAQAQRQAAVERLGDDLDRGIQGDAVAGDGIEDLAVGTGAVEGAVEVGEPLDGGFVARGATGDSGEQVIGLNAGNLSGLPRQDAFGLQAAVRLVPPDAVVRLLEVTFLLKIQDCQHEERGRGQGQQRCLHTVEKTCLHGGSLYINQLCSTLVAKRRNAQAPGNGTSNLQRLREISTRLLVKCQPVAGGIRVANAENSMRDTEKGINLRESVGG